MVVDMLEVVQCEFQYCVIDEVDLILIDEVCIFFIIFGQVEWFQEKYQQVVQVVNVFVCVVELGKDGVDLEGDYEVDEKQCSCIFIDEGFVNFEQMFGVVDLFNFQDFWVYYIINVFKVKELFVKDVNYIVCDGEVVIVDEFIGWVMFGCCWSDGQYQVIEVKEVLLI